MSRTIVLVDHDPKWHRMAKREAERVTQALGDEIVAVHHIGSTAIPGIKAKPILDFLIYVKDLDTLDLNNARLEAIGYLPLGEYGIPGRRYFTKDTGGKRSHQLHCFLDGDSEGGRHKLFRDYLRAHPPEAKEYERLKLGLAAQYMNDINAYADAKTEYIRKVEQEAREWRAKGEGV